MENYMKDYMKNFLTDNEILFIFSKYSWSEDYKNNNPINNNNWFQSKKSKDNAKDEWEKAFDIAKEEVRSSILKKFNEFVTGSTSLIKQVIMGDKFNELNDKNKEDISELEENNYYFFVSKPYFGRYLQEKQPTELIFIGQLKNAEKFEYKEGGHFLDEMNNPSSYYLKGLDFSGLTITEEERDGWPDERKENDSGIGKLYMLDLKEAYNVVKGEAKVIVAKEAPVVKGLSGGSFYRINYSQ